MPFKVSATVADPKLKKDATFTYRIVDNNPAQTLFL